jgi:hypothetical protein
MRLNHSTDLALTVNGREVEQVKSFKYSDSIVTTDGGALHDVCSHIKEELKYVNRNQKLVNGKWKITKWVK